MSISHEDFVKKIAEKAGVSEEEAAKQIKQFANNALNVEKGKPFKIEGLGAFRLKKGRLSFDTDDTLAIEINYRYAGMSPIVIQESGNEDLDDTDDVAKGKVTSPANSSDETNADEKSEEDALNVKKKDAESANKQKAKTDSKAEETSETSAPTASSEAKDTQKTEKSPKSSETNTDEKKENVEKKQETKSGTTTSASSKETVRPEKKDTKPPKPVSAKRSGEKKQTKAEPEKKKKPASKRPEIPKKGEGNRNAILIAVAASVVILIAVIALLNQTTDEMSTDNDSATATLTEQQDAVDEKTTSQSGETADEESDDAAAKTTSETAETEGESQTTDDVSEETTPNADLADPAVNDNAAETVPEPGVDFTEGYGLEGTTNPTLDGYYSIIVHSLKSDFMADAKADEFSEMGYRAVIDEYRSDDGTFYRVGVGQFKSIPDAQNAVEELPDEYKENNFIKRIQ